MTPKQATQVEQYLQRIGHTGSVAPTEATLRTLQGEHLRSIPYENLDILAHKEHSLAYEDLFQRIVLNHRGGYCFELNGLFGWLLRKLGFQTEEFFGRWLAGEPLPVPKRRHRIILVHLKKGDFVADVGIGGPSPIAPLLFEYFREQEREGVLWRIVPDNVLGSVIQHKTNNEWLNYYAFDDAPQQNLDFTYAHYYYTHAPASPFLNKTIVHIRTKNGRNSIYSEIDPDTGLVQPCLTITLPDGTTSSRFLYGTPQFQVALQNYFDLKLPLL
ncbi:MAG: arylamine N-acetyltransferase [Victivallales bacterium]|nr:arylamine N-acetyltransferase [Victivallales bacterium]